MSIWGLYWGPLLKDITIFPRPHRTSAPLQEVLHQVLEAADRCLWTLLVASVYTGVKIGKCWVVLWLLGGSRYTCELAPAFKASCGHERRHCELSCY